jgi:hypothetical protein
MHMHYDLEYLKILLLQMNNSFLCVIPATRSIVAFPHEWLITGFATKVTRQVPHVEQKIAHPSGTPEFTPVLVGFMLFDL